MAGPRGRLIDSAISLVRERGVEATGLAQLLEHSHVARGSIYQHFPDGKLELIEESTRSAGRGIRSALAHLGEAGSDELVRVLVQRTAQRLSDDDFSLGCPIAAAAMAPPEAAGVRRAAAEAFDSWVEEIALVLVREGHEPAEATALAGIVVAAIEGALMRARTARSTQPLTELLDRLPRLFASES